MSSFCAERDHLLVCGSFQGIRSSTVLDIGTGDKKVGYCKECRPCGIVPSAICSQVKPE